jgi:uncharacterized cupin superfamily protein
MEVQPGFYVSRVSTDEWEPDQEIGGLLHMLYDVADAEAGLWRLDAFDEPVMYVPPRRETVLVLEGTARIEIDGGPTLDLTAGDMASIPAGSHTTWHLTTPFREFWVLS